MPHATSDVFSLSDEVLSDSLHFIEEVRPYPNQTDSLALILFDE
jgi:hypothetical protein